MSVVKNLIPPTSYLNKRNNAICYHRVVVILRVGWIPGEFNLADLFTNKTVTGNIRHILGDTNFFYTASPIVDI